MTLTEYQEEFLRAMFELTSLVSDFHLPNNGPLTATAMMIEDDNDPMD